MRVLDLAQTAGGTSTFFNETQLKLKLFLPSFISSLAHLSDWNIQKAITKEKTPFLSKIVIFGHKIA